MSLKISRILHAGYIFECDHTQIAFDPIFENPFSHNCYAFPDVKFDHGQIIKLKLNAVFISHYHDDHCSLESLTLLDRSTPIYIYCLFEEIFSMIKQLGFENVHALSIDVPVRIGTIEITARKALDSEVDSIFQISAAGMNVLNVVDSWIEDETLRQLSKTKWDMILWPFQTMREIEVLSPRRAGPAVLELPPEWIEQLKTLKPRYVVPSSCQFVQESWSWYNHALFPISYKQFEREVRAALSDTKVVRLNPSVSFALHKNSLEMELPLSWVKPVGEQNVDYDYRADLKPPLTSEISRRFSALTKAQAQRVFDYCRVGLLEKYKSLEAPEDIYFKKPRLWRLSVYDHLGDVTEFYYKVFGALIEFVSDSSESVSWATEIPLSKFYAALERGEALTSMYVRINDVNFSPDVEKEIATADVVEDPLVRCLFTGVFGAYQAAQLKRLK